MYIFFAILVLTSVVVIAFDGLLDGLERKEDDDAEGGFNF